VNLPGLRRKTPLHYAALIDNINAAKILVSFAKLFFYRKRKDDLIKLDRS
jgi:hypothetical protein